jgi:ABC-type glycerol-3-phosphate transport system substrate-binding protein
MSPPLQWQWVKGGGMTGLSAILRDPKFMEAARPNKSFRASMSITKDYWHLPTYPQLLRSFQQYVHETIAGQLSPDQALDACAAEQERILQGSPNRKTTKTP